MSKLFFHIQRNPDQRKYNYNNLLNKLNPDESRNNLIVKDKLVIGISNDTNGVIKNDKYIALGVFLNDYKKQYNFGLDVPNGVSAIFKFDEFGNFEVLTNKVASRTVWYFFDENQFIVSTSQRAIINLLGNYEHNTQAASWLISAGNIGPGNSWDKRIKHLNYDKGIFLDFQNWKLLQRDVNPIKLLNEPSHRKTEEFEDILLTSLHKVDLNYANPIITLSGGYDSRFVLGQILKNNPKMESMTWGINNSLYEKDTDGFIASEISKYHDVPFHFFDVEWKGNDFDSFVYNFVCAGEARVDHMSNYLDNFDMWRTINSSGFEVVVRSDEVFGWLPVADEKNVRLLLEMCHINDFSNFKTLQEYGMENTIIPPKYLKEPGETLYTWRDRLFNIQRQTFIQSALHDLFYPYVEMVNPLFSDEIINYARSLNDSERTNKSFYVKSIKKHVDYYSIATRPSYPKREYVLKSNSAFNYFQDLLIDSKSKDLVSDEFLTYIQSNIKENHELIKKGNSKLRTWLSGNLPASLRNVVRKNFREFTLDYNLVAFRISMINQWVRIIEDDLNNEEK